MGWTFLMEAMMSKIKIFLAAPISAFKDEAEYKNNRKAILHLISKLDAKFQVYSEILNIGTLSLYDEPGESVIKDLSEISESDVFIIYHPMNMQTSTFIELGYAIAKEKKIIIIGKMDDLPFLALELSKYSSDIKIVPSSELSESVFKQVDMILCKFFNNSNHEKLN